MVGASIPRITHAGVYTHAGSEIGVASTKAFTAGYCFNADGFLYRANDRHHDGSRLIAFLTELNQIPKLVEQTLKCNDEVKEIAASI